MTNDEFVAYWPSANKDHMTPMEREAGFKRYSEIMGPISSDERPSPAKQEEAKPGYFFLDHASRMLERKPPEWLIKNVLPRYGVALLYGTDGTGKTFLALDLALSCAAEVPFFKRKTNLYGPILYVVAEGRIEDRVEAWLKFHKKKHEDISDFYYVNSCPDLSTEHGRAMVSNAIANVGGPPSLIVVDTLAAASPTGDENSKEGVQPIISFFREQANLYNCCVMFISHRGKDVTRGVRGWSGQRGNSDCVIEVSREGNAHQWLVSKLREGEDGQSEAFALRFVDVGYDEEGVYQSRCVEHLEVEKDE